MGVWMSERDCVYIVVVLFVSLNQQMNADHWSFVPSFRCLFLHEGTLRSKGQQTVKYKIYTENE